ncbi:ATPase [Ancylomarina salipaludis]|uniref:ATPase n=1 Tax=Ancylomarina salipaludis TaxID=2501299 RepID=A0A4V1N0A7_9BACT|nr:heavy-metal-associated domain-containing protein [Ancylomarina salipaludis]RXQ95923.1 ATPase [Ancylomarina salipaludis]
MRTKILSLGVLFLMGTMSLLAQSKTEKFKVYGNCSMCEKTIEKAAQSVEGVTAADWNKETKMMEVSFDKAKTNVHKVHMAIAKVGYDTEMHKANDEAYKKLPACCKYERAKSVENEHKSHKGHDHSNCTDSQKKSKSSSCCKK